ncbi:MAG TPA: sugar efflux transporter, partial [Sporolactobacillaceae bacterium]|nr:sugar efflux transporter [Sporolactobacillaceae bacterium]
MQAGLVQLKQASLSLFRVKGFTVLVLINMLLGVANSFIGPYNSLFGIEEVGMSNLSFGVFMTLSAISGVIVNTLIGRLSDFKINRRSLLLIAATAGTLGYLGFAFIRNYYILLGISMFILGVASSSFSQIFAYTRETIVTSSVNDKDVPLYMNVFRMFFALSWTVGPAIASLVLLRAGYRGLFLCASLFYFLIVMVTLFYLKTNPTKSVQIGARVPSKLRSYIFQPYIAANLVAFALIQASITLSVMNVGLFVTKVLHASAGQVGIIFSVPPIFEVPFMLGFGVIATKIDNKILIRLGACLAAAYFTLFFFVQHPWEIYLIQILSAAFISITNGIAITYFQNFIPG